MAQPFDKTEANVAAHTASVGHLVRRADARRLDRLFRDGAGRTSGGSLIGQGRYRFV